MKIRIIAAILILAYVPSASAEDRLLSNGQAWLDAVHPSIEHISTDGLVELLEQAPETEFIEVRLIEEITAQGGLIDAGRRTHHIPWGWIEFRVGETIPRLDTPIVVYCSTNRRSPLVAATLSRMGYTNVKNYSDGFLAWSDSGGAVESLDEAVGTQLFSLPIEVAPNVYSAIGATATATFENSGHNNNLSFVIGEHSVLAVNAGDNYLLAQALHNEIKKVTDKPVNHAVLENGQGHAMLGMNYWQEQGAEVIAHRDAADVIAGNGEAIYGRMLNRNRDKAMGTFPFVPDTTFDEKLVIDLGGLEVEGLYLGPAHSPGM